MDELYFDWTSFSRYLASGMRLMEIKFKYFLFCWFFVFLLKNKEPFQFMALGPFGSLLLVLDWLGFALPPPEALNAFGMMTHHPKGALFFVPL